MAAPKPFKPEYCEQARNFCLLNKKATDKDIARHLHISKSLLYEWKAEHPELSAAIDEGKYAADCDVARSLYDAAMGYEHPSEEIFYDQKNEKIVRAPTTKKYAPDTQAAKFWLCNRQPELFQISRKVDITIDDPKKHLAELLGLPEDELP